VTGAFLDGVALSALGLEDLLSGGLVPCWGFAERRHSLSLSLPSLIRLLSGGVMFNDSGLSGS